MVTVYGVSSNCLVFSAFTTHSHRPVQPVLLFIASIQVVSFDLPLSLILHLVILIREDFLTPLTPSHALLLLLPCLRACELLLGLFLDLVAHGVELLGVIAALLVDTRTGTLSLDPVVARWSHFPIKNSPY